MMQNDLSQALSELSADAVPQDARATSDSFDFTPGAPVAGAVGASAARTILAAADQPAAPGDAADPAWGDGGWTGGTWEGGGWTGGDGSGGGWTGGGDGGGWTGGGGSGGGWTGGGDGGGWGGGDFGTGDGQCGGGGGEGFESIPKQRPVELTFDYNGVERTYFIDLPDSYDETDPNQSFSAIFAFHGGEGDAHSMIGATDFGDYGDAQDFIAIYPEAIDGQWNDGRGDGSTGTADDIGFVLALIDALAESYSVDAARVFATGISGGGTFTQRLALEVPDAFAGYGVVAANLFNNSESLVQPSGDLPMAFFHYTEDPAMPFDGGGPNGPLMSAEDTVNYWAALNGSAMGGYTQLPDIADDGMTTSMRVSDDGTIEHYVIDGASHLWPGMDVTQTSIDGVTQDIEASQIMVDLFTDYGL